MLVGVIRWLRERAQAGDSLLTYVIAAPFTAQSLALIVGATRPPQRLALWSAGALVLAVIAGAVALLFQRARPMASFIVVSAASLAQAAIPGAPPVLPSLAIFPLSLYAYCAYGQRRAPVLGLVVGAGGAAVTTAQLALTGQAARGQVPLLLLFGTFIAIALAALSLGLFRRVQLTHVAALEDRAARAEAEREERARRAILDERARIAREMHDVIAHALAVIVSQAQGGQYAARDDPARAAEVLATIAQAGRQALADTRGLLGVLHPGTPDTAPDGRVPQPTLRELPGLLDRVRAAGVPVRYTEHGPTFPPGPAAELALYRLVQEALTNTLKHGGPGARATVRFAWAEEGLALTVSDTGRGPAPGDGAGRGLVGMRERLIGVGGSVVSGPGPTGGFVVRAWVPRPAAVEGMGP